MKLKCIIVLVVLIIIMVFIYNHNVSNDKECGNNEKVSDNKEKVSDNNDNVSDNNEKVSDNKEIINDDIEIKIEDTDIKNINNADIKNENIDIENDNADIENNEHNSENNEHDIENDDKINIENDKTETQYFDTFVNEKEDNEITDFNEFTNDFNVDFNKAFNNDSNNLDYKKLTGNPYNYSCGSLNLDLSELDSLEFSSTSSEVETSPLSSLLLNNKDMVCNCGDELIDKIQKQLELDYYFVNYVNNKMINRSSDDWDVGKLVAYASYIMKHISLGDLKDIKLKSKNTEGNFYSKLSEDEAYEHHIYLDMVKYTTFSSKSKIEHFLDQLFEVYGPNQTLILENIDLDTDLCIINKEIIERIIDKNSVLLEDGMNELLQDKNIINLNNVKVSAIDYVFIFTFRSRTLRFHVAHI